MFTKKQTTTRNSSRNSKKEVKQDCYFCKSGGQPEYKDVLVLKRFISDRGKIIAGSKSGVCSKHQRGLTTTIKRARHMVLLPYTDRHSLI